MNLLVCVFTFFSVAWVVNVDAVAPVSASKKTHPKNIKGASALNAEITIPVACSPSRKLVDKVVARVNGSNIMLSDLTIPRIDRDGEPFVSKAVLDQHLDGLYRKGLEEAIDDQLLFLKAAERKLLPTDIDVEKRIIAFKTMNKLTSMSEEEFDKHLKSIGLSARQYRTQLARTLAINNLKQTEMSERLVVTSQEAEEYYRLHREYQEEHYTFKIASFQSQDAIIPTKKQLLERRDVIWETSPVIPRSKIARHLDAVFTMKEGEITGPLKTETGYQLIMLLKREDGRFKTLDEQYHEIEKTLQEQKRERFEKEFLTELRQASTVIYL